MSKPSQSNAGEPLSLTVHSQPQPGLDQSAVGTWKGRVKMLLVLATCAAPVIASYLTYFVIRPDTRSNYSSLISPTRAVPVASLRTLDGQPVAAQTIKGQWLLIMVGPAACDATCEGRLFMQRQLREMLGRERERIDKVWLVSDDAQVKPSLLAQLQAPGATRVLRIERSALASWLVPDSGRQLEDHFYVVDPMGEWMMRVPAEPDPAKVKRDLERLLRASASWDRAGR